MSIAKVKRTKRLQLMQLQTRIEQEICVSCEFNESKYQTSACEGCFAFKQLNSIGKELINISATDKTIKLLNVPKRHRNDDTNGNRKSSMKFMTWDIYWEYKNKDLKDKQIAELLGVNHSTFRNWKRRNSSTNPCRGIEL